MNQKDYKAISGIIKGLRDDVIPTMRFITEHCAERLADYFEREQGYVWSKEHCLGFNRQQFLKDCGVD